MRWMWLALLVACGGSASTPAAAPADQEPSTARPESAASAQGAIDDVVGQPAPGWEVSRWFNSPPLRLEDLRGKVVFVRWFTSPDCPFCTASAPVLRALHDRYAARGLVVVGMYHHKSDAPLEPDDVAGWAKHYGYTFPVAIDAGWKTLKRYWLDGRERPFTSVSFLVDKRGVIRHVHPGGTISETEQPGLEARVEQLLAE
jgi:peroxiredoxin